MPFDGARQKIASKTAWSAAPVLKGAPTASRKRHARSKFYFALPRRSRSHAAAPKNGRERIFSMGFRQGWQQRTVPGLGNASPIRESSGLTALLRWCI